MSKVKSKTSFKSLRTKKESPFNDYWSVKNIVLFAFGLVLLIIGNYFLSIPPFESTESVYTGPIILIAAYLIVFPLAILFTGKKKN